MKRILSWTVYIVVVGGLLVGSTLLLASTAHAEDGLASYYTVKSCQREGTSGVYTANGERFKENALTCALRRRDFGRNYLVCGPIGCVEVRHNDFGPGRGPTAKGVIIDLTPKAFKAVCGDLRQGVCNVGVTDIIE